MLNDNLSDAVEWSLGDRYNLTLPVDRRSNKKKNFFYKDQLQGMRDIKLAWSRVSSATVANCYLHTGLFAPRSSSAEDAVVARREASEVLNEINQHLSLWSIHLKTGEEILEEEEEESGCILETINDVVSEEKEAEEEEERASAITASERSKLLINTCRTLLELAEVNSQEDVAFLSSVADYASKLVQEESSRKTKQSDLNSYFKSI